MPLMEDDPPRPFPREYNSDRPLRPACGEVRYNQSVPRRQSPFFYDRLMHECFRGGLKAPHIVQEALDTATMVSLVSCGLGAAFVNEATRWRCPKNVVLLSMSHLNLSIPFALVWRKD